MASMTPRPAHGASIAGSGATVVIWPPALVGQNLFSGSRTPEGRGEEDGGQDPDCRDQGRNRCRGAAQQRAEGHAEQTDRGAIQADAEHRPGDARVRQGRGRCLAGDQRLTEQERGEGHDETDGQCHRADHHGLGAEQPSASGYRHQAVRVERVAYSEVMASVPRTAIASCAKKPPAVETPVGSQLFTDSPPPA